MTSMISRLPDHDEIYPYVVTNEIGKGSFATVYHGYNTRTRQAVAIKAISRSILTTKGLEHSQSEINILRSLENRHITELKDVITSDRNIHLIMEFCAGGDLLSYIRHRGRIPALHAPDSPLPTCLSHPKSGGLSDAVVRSFTSQLASAVKFLRARDLIHRDIKPQNILLAPATSIDEYSCVGNGGWIPGLVGTPILKLGDFGLARVLPNLSMASTLCGTPWYMAPEILRGEKYDATVDLWSAGAVIYEMAVGDPPFKARTQIEMLNMIEHTRGQVCFPDEDHQHANAVAVGDLVPVSANVKYLIRSMLQKKPSERASFEMFFLTAEDLVKQPTTREDIGLESERTTRATAMDRTSSRSIEVTWANESSSRNVGVESRPPRTTRPVLSPNIRSRKGPKVL